MLRDVDHVLRQRPGRLAHPDPQQAVAIAHRVAAQDVIDIPEHDNPSWHLTQGDRLHCACHYLWLVDNLLDPSHVAWVHRGSFAGASTDRTPLDLTVSASGVTSSRWLLNQPPLPFYAPLVKFNGPADRLQHYEACYPSVAINKSVYTPAGAGGPGSGDGPETYHMVLLQLGLPDEFIEHGDHAKLLSGLGLDAAGIEAAVRRRSYNFLTPVDDDRTLYFWLQQRNTDPQDEGITQRNASGAKAGFEEDRLILEAMHQGMKHKTTPTTGLLLDAAASRFRQGLARLIAVEAGTQVDSPSIE